jgi:hypothetical protein
MLPPTPAQAVPKRKKMSHTVRFARAEKVIRAREAGGEPCKREEYPSCDRIATEGGFKFVSTIFFVIEVSGLPAGLLVANGSQLVYIFESER